MKRLNKPAKLNTSNGINTVAQCMANEVRRGQASVLIATTVLNEIKDVTGLTNLCKINENHVETYVDHLLNRVQDENLSPNTACCRISALNRVLDYSKRDDLKVSAKENGIERTRNDASDKSNDRQTNAAYQEWLSERAKTDPRYENLLRSRELQTELGLRARESYGVKAKDKNPASGSVHLGRADCTKNGRDRNISITSNSQREALGKAKEWAKSQGQNSLIPNNYTLAEWRTFANDTMRQFNKEHGTSLNNHGERHFYAHQRFNHLWQERTGHNLQCPAVMGMEREQWYEHAKEQTGLTDQELKKLDNEIRLQVSEDLGHSRVSITKTYLG